MNLEPNRTRVKRDILYYSCQEENDQQNNVLIVEWGQIFSLDKSSCFGNIGAWQDP